MEATTLSQLKPGDKVIIRDMTAGEWHYVSHVISRRTPARLYIHIDPYDYGYRCDTGESVPFQCGVMLPFTPENEKLLADYKRREKRKQAFYERQEVKDADPMRWVGGYRDWLAVFGRDTAGLHELANRVRAWRRKNGDTDVE